MELIAVLLLLVIPTIAAIALSRPRGPERDKEGLSFFIDSYELGTDPSSPRAVLTARFPGEQLWEDSLALHGPSSVTVFPPSSSPAQLQRSIGDGVEVESVPDRRDNGGPKKEAHERRRSWNRVDMRRELWVKTNSWHPGVVIARCWQQESSPKSQGGGNEQPRSQSAISSGQHGSSTAPLVQRSDEYPSLHEQSLNSHNRTTGQEAQGVPELVQNDTRIEIQGLGDLSSQSAISIGQHGSPTALLLPRSHEQPSSQSAISRGQHGSSTAPLVQRSDEATDGDTEVVKHARKVAYCTIAIAGAGIFTIIYGFAEGQIKQAYNLHLKICALFLLTSFISAACLILLTAPHRNTNYWTKIVSSLVYMTLGALVLAVVHATFIFMKLLVLIFEVLILFFLLLAFHLGKRSTVPQPRSFGV